MKRLLFSSIATLTLFANCAADPAQTVSEANDNSEQDTTENSGDGNENESNSEPNGDVNSTSPSLKRYEIEFRSTFEGQDFECGENYVAGSDNAEITPTMNAFYIHDVEMQNSQGEWVALHLPDDGVWQKSGIVLLDFDTTTGACSAITTERNSKVVGFAPDDTYTSLRYKLGVPGEFNNLDFSLQEAPLNVSYMFWGWMSGYRYIRLEFGATERGNPSLLHIGSTACQGNPFEGQNMTCDYPNRFEYVLNDFDPEESVVNFDVEALLAPHELAPPNIQGGLICEAGRLEPDCPMVFETLGDGDAEQTLFYLSTRE